MGGAPLQAIMATAPNHNHADADVDMIRTRFAESKRSMRQGLASALFVLACTSAGAADRAWVAAEVLAHDSSRWPDVAVMLQITEVDGHGGDSRSDVTRLPDPLNPFDCFTPDDPKRACWRVNLTQNGQALAVQQQKTILDLDHLHRQYLWLVYRAAGEPARRTPVTLTLARITRNGVVAAAPLHSGRDRFALAPTPAARIAASPWPYLLPLAEQRLSAAERLMSPEQDQQALPELWAAMTDRDCQFEVAAGLNDADGCRYEHLRAQADALTHPRLGSGK